MNPASVDGALRLCEAHVSALESGVANSVEIESFLVSFLCTTIVAEFEGASRTAFCERAEQCGDPPVAAFVEKALRRRFWSPELSKLAETLGEFGPAYREAFMRRVENTRAHASWDNLIRARHEVVHKRGVPNLTLREVRGSYEEAKTVLLELRSALTLKETGSQSGDGAPAPSGAQASV